MKESIFRFFKKNTDANATNKGFYYQYLITLKTWLENKDNENLEIFCETEEDILTVNELTREKVFSQVKCYSTDFSLQSEPVVESLVNFYKLYRINKENFATTFNFVTNAGIKPRAGKTLANWFVKQQEGDFDVDSILEECRTLFKQQVFKQLEIYLAVDRSETDKEVARKSAHELENEIDNPSFKDFLGRIRWEFRSLDQDNFQTLYEQIGVLLSHTHVNKNIRSEISISYLLKMVIETSAQERQGDRVLTSSLLNEMISNTANTDLIIRTVEKDILQIVNQFLVLDKQLSEVHSTTKKIISMLEDKDAISPLGLLKQRVMNWCIALDYEVCDLLSEKADFFYFNIRVQERRRTVDVLIYGLVREIGMQDFNQVDALRKSVHCDEAWVITTSYPSPAVLQRTNDNTKGDVLCYNFDEFLEDTINFSKYIDWIEAEVSNKRMEDRYIPLGAKKVEYDRTTKEMIATNLYGKSEGWLDGYIDSWVDDKQKEHISILGEFGTGKTWFTLFTTWRFIQRFKESKEKKLPRPRIPILIPLRDFSKALQVDVLVSDFFFRKHQIEIKGAFKAFMLLNEMGKLLLIFDGFDEMAEKVDRQKMIDNFWELASIIKGDSKVILTCRNEHFSTIIEGRNLLASEYTQTTKNLKESPKFEVVELLKFNSEQIKQVLGHITNKATIDYIFENESIVDLLTRPIMSELIIDAIKDIEDGKKVDLARVYLYAIRRKMERDILQQRTFTSLEDKIFFMCELSWEMLSKDKLTISYKEFPSIIFNYFKNKAADTDLDYWRYDMRGQSILIIDEEGGSYKPAHKSFLEFFVALKFASELGILQLEYQRASNGENLLEIIKPLSVDRLKDTVGAFSFTSDKLEVVSSFLNLMIEPNCKYP